MTKRTDRVPRLMRRDDRQEIVGRWCREAFGEDHATNVEQRAVRLLEEAIELYQAAGGSRSMAHALVNYIFDREPGKVAQEVGGVSVTLLAFCEAAMLSADGEERREIDRVLSKPPEHWRKRNDIKDAAGFKVT